MASGLACRICSGDLTLRVRGRGEPLTAAALSPSAHATGRHGDMLACVECGSVQQPVLPKGAALHDLYRDMADEAYLGEESGPARDRDRLLDLVGRFVPAGRLLDVGCGPGLLLDEARDRGYETVGLELSPRVGGARPRRARPRRARARRSRTSPTTATRRASTSSCSRTSSSTSTTRSTGSAAAPPCCGPAACSASSRPTRRRAPRARGRRWWGYVPAHTCLLPRRTLRELLAAAGLVVSTDVPLVRTFSARRWVEGLAERLGPASAPLDAAARRLPAGARSASRSATSASCSPTASRSRHRPSRCSRARRADGGARRPARLPRRADDPRRGRGDAGGRRRPRAARSTTRAPTTPRRPRSPTASRCCATRRTAAMAPARRRATRGR